MTCNQVAKNLLLVGGGADAIAVRYASGFTAPDPFIYVEKGTEKHLLVSMLEIGRASKLNESILCHTPQSLGLSASDRKNLSRQVAGLLNYLNLKRISVSRQCPVGLVRELEKAGFKVLVPQKPLYPQRLVKSEQEVAALKFSQRAAVAAMKDAIALIKSTGIDSNGFLVESTGQFLSSEKVRAVIEKTLIDHNCFAEDIIVAGGDQAVDPHERGHGPLRAREFIVLDIFPCSKESGYWGDITRTVMKGEPSPEQKKLITTVIKTQKAALTEVKAGADAKAIHENICAAFEQAGYQTGMKDGVPQGFIHSTGHGVGLEIHEQPSVSPLGKPLEAGQVITIEPGLYYLGLGGVRIEDTVVVTESGCTPLARCAKKWLW